MAPSSESLPSSVNSQERDPNQFGDSSSSNTNVNAINSPVNKAKSCKGCLYYSSTFKPHSINPIFLGLTRSLPNVPQFVVGQSEMEASKDGRSLDDFRYGCIGYSLYVDRKGENSSGQVTPTELPVCAGIEVLVDRHVHSADSVSPPMTRIHNKEDDTGLPQRRSTSPPNSNGEEFLSRFARNAGLVANGVAKNIRKVGNRIKQDVDDVLYPYRRRPK